jgi:hypothetical protein
VLLLAVLVTMGMALAFVSSNFYTGVFLSPKSSESGLLVVKVVSGTATQGTPIVGATVLIDAGSRASGEFTTNPSGEVEVQLSVGNHSLAVFNDQFRAERSVPIQDKDTTITDVYVTRNSVSPVLTEFTDPDGTGYANVWQPITTAVNASSANLLLSSDGVFFDAAYVPGTNTTSSSTSLTTSTNTTSTMTAADATSATSSSSQGASPASNVIRALAYSQPINGSATGLWWFSWLPSVPLSLAGLSNLTLSTYSAEIQVEIVGP